LDRWCIVVFVVVGFRKMSISREELLRIIHKSKKLIRPSTSWDGVNVCWPNRPEPENTLLRTR
jgi:hypothetical protein